MKRTLIAFFAAAVIGTTAATAQNFSLWLTTEGAGITVNSGFPAGPPPPPPMHHGYPRPAYCPDARHYHHVSKKIKKRYKKLRKARKEYEKAQRKFYHSMRHGHHHDHDD